MSDRPTPKDLDEVFRHPEIIAAALDEAYYKAVRKHRRNGVPMVFWEDGKIIVVSADQVPLPEDAQPARPE